jgi:hypothetical protein
MGWLHGKRSHRDHRENGYGTARAVLARHCEQVGRATLPDKLPD